MHWQLLTQIRMSCGHPKLIMRRIEIIFGCPQDIIFCVGTHIKISPCNEDPVLEVNSSIEIIYAK